MKKFVALSALLLIPLTVGSGCRRAADAAMEAAEEEIAEALAEQAISGYHTAAINISVNNASFELSCEHGGTLEWSAADGDGICYETEAKACTLGVNNKKITLSGPYKVCGYPVAVEDASGAEDLEGSTLTIEGSVTASGETSSGQTLTSRTCNYALTMSNMELSGSDNALTMGVDVSGEICGEREFSLSTSVTVSGSVSVSNNGTSKP